MFGAPTINSVNIYPALDRWKKLDPNGENFQIYNRYAHIRIKLGNEPTKFYPEFLDAFNLDLNVDDIPKLEIKYIMSRNHDLENLSSANVKIKKKFSRRE